MRVGVPPAGAWIIRSRAGQLTSARVFLLGRHSELEDGAMRHVCGCPQSAAMHLNDRAGDSQTDTKAIVLGGEESFEEALLFAGRKSNADIRHNNQHIP